MGRAAGSTRRPTRRPPTSSPGTSSARTGEAAGNQGARSERPIGMRPRRGVAMTIALALGTAGTGCGDDEPRAAVPLTEGDACGDAWFWAATEAGGVAITVSVDARDRAKGAATTIAVDVGGPAVSVEALRG